jgi:hypothetical protein
MFKYFQTLPLTFYSLDEYESAKIIPNIFVRSKFLSNVITNSALFDLYNIRDGDTPEITANKFYGDTGLYWIILQANDITDPRFGWPLDQFNLKKFVEGKYTNINATHHYEDSGGNVVNATVLIQTDSTDPITNFTGFANNTVVTNNTNIGTGFITSKTNTDTVTIVTTSGGFIAGDQVLSAANSLASATLDSVSVQNGLSAANNSITTTATPITNFIFEDLENEKKRSIKVVKRELVSEIISEFEEIMTK